MNMSRTHTTKWSQMPVISAIPTATISSPPTIWMRRELRRNTPTARTAHAEPNAIATNGSPKPRQYATIIATPRAAVVSAVPLAVAMIAASGREDIGILVDALHFWRAGESLAALSSLPAHHLNYMQLCDGAAQRPESEQELIRQARSARNVPGEGGLDLHGLMSALPATLPVSLEVPLDGEQGALPPLQRAQLLFNAAQPYLRSCA